MRSLPPWIVLGFLTLGASLHAGLITQIQCDTGALTTAALNQSCTTTYAMASATQTGLSVSATAQSTSKPPNNTSTVAIANVDYTGIYLFTVTGGTGTVQVTPLVSVFGGGDSILSSSASVSLAGLVFQQNSNAVSTLVNVPPTGQTFTVMYGVPTQLSLTLSAHASSAGEAVAPGRFAGAAPSASLQGFAVGGNPNAVFSFTQVPEPSSLLLLGFGLLGMALLARRNQAA